jgi:superfamily II DNA/RNA helicase
MDSFDELGVQPCFIEKLKKRSIVKPTAIQSLVIPQLLEGKGALFRSATGTGKTFAYLLPILQADSVKISHGAHGEHGGHGNTEIRRREGIRILICAPTLELCSQIKEEIEFLTDLPSALLIGSAGIEKQIESLKRVKPVIAVGNPSRLLNLAKMKKLRLDSLKFLVLDEADRLTAQECVDETRELLKLIARFTKDLCLAACSATVGKKTAAQLGPLFENIEIIESEDHEILRERIEHWAIFSERRRKSQTLRSLLSAVKSKKKHIKALVFTSRGDEAGKILAQLQYHHIAAAGLIGKVNKKPQSSADRKASLEAFREGKADVLVSTDLAARGLDIPGITHVIAMDVPQDGEQYIHRCGRTGRALKRGIMVTIGDETQMRLLASMEKKLKIRVMPKELYEGRVCAIQSL